MKWRILVSVALLTTGHLAAGTAHWTFEGLLDMESVLSYYAGGAGSAGSVSGQSSGVWFGSDLVALIDRDAGGTGNFAKAPSGVTVLGFLGAASAFFEAGPGLEFASISFFYTPPGQNLALLMFSGPGGTGSLVGALTVPGGRDTCGVDPPEEFSCWIFFTGLVPAGVKSLSLPGWQGLALLDDVTASTVNAVSEPPSFALLGIAAVFFALIRAKRHGRKQTGQHEESRPTFGSFRVSAQLPTG